MTRRSPGRARDIPTVVDRSGKLPTGIEGQNIPEDFSIPSVGVEDVDRSVFKLFEDRIRLQVTSKNNTVKVPTFFSGRERFAIAKKNRLLRDRNNTLILPLVSIRRASVEQSKMGVITGRGMGTNTGDLVIKKRLSSEDPRYQNLINKLQLKNQENVAASSDLDPGRLSTRRIKQSSFNKITGDYLAPDLNGQNIYEVITMPFPHFYTAFYEVIFWSQYIQHMNQMIERFMTSYDAQGNGFRLDTEKGYWFVGYVDDDVSLDDNFNDYTGEERIIRASFTIRVPAYMHAPQNPGDPIPFRSFLSAPQVSFELCVGNVPSSRGARRPAGTGDKDKFILSDTEQLDRRGDSIIDPRVDSLFVEESISDPFSGKDRTRSLRIVSCNPKTGETILQRRTGRTVDTGGVP